MTTPVAPAAAASPADRLAPLRPVVETVLRDFTDLGYLAAKGVLEVPVTVGPVHRVRLELPQQFLHVQSIAFDTEEGSDATVGAEVTASSWYGTYGERFSPEALFDWDHPTGTVVHTEKDDPSWVEIAFPTPVRLTAIRLRNIVGETSTRAAKLRVIARTRFRSHVLFDGGRRHKELRAAAAGIETGGDRDLELLRDVLVDTASGAYAKGKATLASSDLDADLVKAFRGLVNEKLLPSRELMWTIHGPCRSFRFWSKDEQLTYVTFASEVVDVLRDLTPHVSLGFGSVLSVVRDRALIPHDDDLDLIIGFEPEEAATLADGLALVASFLTERGYAVRGNWSAHRQVARTPKGKHLDIFVGLFEGDAISWYPGTRGALDRDTMYPTSQAELLGVPCRIPARPETYLERLYGPGWISPDPNFAHRWDRSAYADLAGGSAPASAAAEPAAD